MSRMSLGGLIVGGKLEMESGHKTLGDGTPVPAPVFTFVAKDVREVEARIENHFVSFDIRYIAGGQKLAYHMGVPDLRLDPAAIAFSERDAFYMSGGQMVNGGIRTLVVDDKGRELRLDRFTTGLYHELTRIYANAHGAFIRAEAEPDVRDEMLALAVKILAEVTEAESRYPAAFHLMGRCFRARGDLNGAVYYYQEAIRHATVDLGDRLIPWASGPLSDLGVALKKLGDERRARWAFRHSLRLRPNHPEALLTLGTMCTDDPPLLGHVIARVIAIGGRDDLLDGFVKNVAAAGGASSESLLAQGKADASKIDLATWPFANAEFDTYEHFSSVFDESLAVDDEAPISASNGKDYRSPPVYRDAPVSDPGEDPLAGLAAEIALDQKKPWWKKLW